MNGDFIEYLASKIKNDAAKFISSHDNNLRVTFTAPPSGILDAIYEKFLKCGDRLELTSNGHVKSVPVLRVQEGVEDPPHQNTARCSSNHVVSVRTSYGSYLALSTLNTPPLLSTGTTANKLGLNRVNHVSFSTWKDEPFVNDVVTEVLARFSYTEEVITELVWKALEEAFIESAQAGDMKEPWELMQALYDLGGYGKTGHDLCHALGVPKLAEGEIPDTTINQNIANYLQAQGFTAGTKLLQEDAGSEHISEALALFSQHLVMMYRTPQRFVASPIRNYASVRNIPDSSWWDVLTQSTWIKLLNQEESKNFGTLKVACENLLFRPTLSSQQVVVKDTPIFSLSADEELLGQEVSVYRASGRKALELIDSIKIEQSKTEWSDDSLPCSHEQHLRYEFSCKSLEKPASIKIISLDSYTPAVALNCRSAQKLTSFKRKTVGRGKNLSSIYECELITNGSGTQTIELFYNCLANLSSSISGTTVEDSDSTPTNWPITNSEAESGQSLAVVEISEDGQLNFEVRLPNSEVTTKFIINVSPKEFTAKGAPSEFARLVINNCSRSESVAKTDVEQTMLTLLEQWILESEDSYQPLIIGPGFKASWSRPDWKLRPKLSDHEVSLDPRPRAGELSPPEEYLRSRARALELLRGLCNDKGCSIEALSLGQILLDQSNRDVIESYIREYAEWLATPNSLAGWAELITVHKSQLNSGFLESKPVAILLSPFHPVRLAWQCNAQMLMQGSINEGLPCPIAGIIEPYSFPDCLALKCRDMDGRFAPAGYVAVKSSSDYWSVLWRTDLIHEVAQANFAGTFGDDLGIKLEGMVNGFNKQQVKRSLDEIRHLYPAKSTIRVSLHSDLSGHSSCNEGIDEWCLENLGPEVDEWSPAQGLTLRIIDKRPPDEQPKPAVLASLTERSGTQIRWYSKSKEGHAERDLSIVDHLQTMDQQFRKDGVLSPVDPTCVSRFSIKKNATSHKQYLSLSRAGQYVRELGGDGLLESLSRALDLLESQCVNEAQFDCLSFAPNLQTLNASLKDTRYSAISSAAVDSTCFHSPGNNAYLWDFELPRYAPGAGHSSGFYLVAKQSPTMITAVRNVLMQLPGIETTSDEQVSSLLDEISKRGIPTLKRLTSGGAASLGEVGMLIAARLLQSNYNTNGKFGGLIPAIGNRTVNLIIPADVFQPRFDELRKALGMETRERPDLLVLSIAFGIDSGNNFFEPNFLKITPIEVKTRSNEMTEKQRDDALAQAQSFATFLSELQERAVQSPLWGIAYRDLIGGCVDYGFRVYGDTDAARANPHWVNYHQQTIAGLMSGSLETEIDQAGRLISIEKTQNSRILSSGSSLIKNIAILGHDYAGALLATNQLKPISDMIDQVGDWGLLANINTEVEEKISVNTAPQEGVIEQNNLYAPHPYPFIQPEAAFKVAEQYATEETLETIDPLFTKGLNFKIGDAKDLIGSKEVYFNPGNTELTNINIGVVGDLGTGKTQLLKSLVYQMVKQPEQNRGTAPKVLILDYKRDFSDQEDTCEFIKKSKVKIVSPYKIPLNLFSTGGDSSNRAMLDKIGFFRDILRKIFSVNAPVQDKNLKEAIKAAYHDTRAAEDRDPSIYDVSKQYSALVGDKPDSVLGIISDLVDYEIFEEDPSKIVSFDEFFEGVVAIDLKDLSDEKLKKMVVVIFLNLYFDYMLKLKKRPFIGKSPQTRYIDSYLLVDEAHNIMPYDFDVLTKLLVQGRAFGVGVILASQYFSHFKTSKTDYLEPIGSWFIHQVPGLTARDLDKIGLPAASDSIVNRISSLDKFNSLCKTLNWSGEFIEEVPFYKLD